MVPRSLTTIGNGESALKKTISKFQSLQHRIILAALIGPLLSFIATPEHAVALTCPEGGVCQVGDIGPGGGKVFYVEPGNGTFEQIGASGTMCTTNCKYLEAAPSSWNGGGEPSRSWATNINNNRTTSVPAPGATQTAIGTGYQNSVAIVAQAGNESDTSAAVAARAYAGGGKNDWYLPSKEELNQLYSQKTTVGVFENDVYWSSSEYSASHAWLQSFVDGSLGEINKSWPIFFSHSYVRPIRAFAPSYTITIEDPQHAVIYDPYTLVTYETQTVISVPHGSDKTLCVKTEPGYEVTRALLSNGFDLIEEDQELFIFGGNDSDLIGSVNAANDHIGFNCHAFEDISEDHSFFVTVARSAFIDSIFYSGPGPWDSDTPTNLVRITFARQYFAVGDEEVEALIDFSEGWREWAELFDLYFCEEDGRGGYTNESPGRGPPEGFFTCELPFDGDPLVFIIDNPEPGEEDKYVVIETDELGTDDILDSEPTATYLLGGEVSADAAVNGADITITTPLSFTVGGSKNPTLNLYYRVAIYDTVNPVFYAEEPDEPVYEETILVAKTESTQTVPVTWKDADPTKTHVVYIFLEVVDIFLESESYQLDLDPAFFSNTFLPQSPPAAPTLTITAISDTATVGSPITSPPYTVASSGESFDRFSISPSLPSGITFDTATALISGTPSASNNMTTYTVTGFTLWSETSTATFNLQVLPQPSAPPAPPVIIYVAPTPVPYLKTLTTPKLNLKDGKLMCTPGTYNAGYTLDGVVQGSATALFTPSSFTYNLLVNGVSQTSLAVTSNTSSHSWNMPTGSTGSLLTCSVTVTANGLTNTDKSTDNASAISSALSTQATSIATANADYSALLSANSKAYQKALADNRTKWRSDTEKIRIDYYAERDHIKSLPSTKTTRALSSAALKAYSAAIKRAAADYKASQPAALAVRDAANKTALAARDEAISKANTTYGTFIESIGYGVLIP